MTIFCPNCGKPNTDTATQCVSCNTALKAKPGASKFKGTLMMSGVGGYGAIVVYSAEERRTRFLEVGSRTPASLDPSVFRPPTPGYASSPSLASTLARDERSLFRGVSGPSYALTRLDSCW